jgi:hypothetical protein
MVASKCITASRHDPSGPAGIIVSKLVANLRSIPPKQAQNAANRQDQQQLITIAAYHYCASKIEINGG